MEEGPLAASGRAGAGARPAWRWEVAQSRRADAESGVRGGGDSEGGPFAWLGLGLRIYASARLEVLALLPSGCALVLTPLNAVVFTSGLAELQAVGGPAGRAERGCGYPAGDVPHHWWELNGETGQARGHLPRR